MLTAAATCFGEPLESWPRSSGVCSSVKRPTLISSASCPSALSLTTSIGIVSTQSARVTMIMITRTIVIILDLEPARNWLLLSSKQDTDVITSAATHPISFANFYQLEL